MKLEIKNLEKLKTCDHCYCIDTTIKTGSKQVGEAKTIDGIMGIAVQDVYTPHKKCCNCGATKIL